MIFHHAGTPPTISDTAAVKGQQNADVALRLGACGGFESRNMEYLSLPAVAGKRPDFPAGSAVSTVLSRELLLS